LSVRSPIDGAEIARIRETPAADMPAIIERAHAAFLAWREVPLRDEASWCASWARNCAASKRPGRALTLEVGKITSEGLGEVQEMIDICDFAVGLSRQLYGARHRFREARHRMTETWHPWGRADHFRLQFPSRRLVLECGAGARLRRSCDLEAVEKTPLSALATMKIFERALKRFGPTARRPCPARHWRPGYWEALVASKRVPIVSATGSTRMGSIVGPKVAARFGRPILELGATMQ